MNAYSLLASLHVLAVVGAGLLLAVALGAKDPALTPLLSRLTRAVGLSLGALLLTGLGLVALSGNTWVHTWWFRISFLLYLALGALHGMSSRALKTQRLQRASSLAFAACAVLALILVLMEAKPF